MSSTTIPTVVAGLLRPAAFVATTTTSWGPSPGGAAIVPVQDPKASAVGGFGGAAAVTLSTGESSVT